MSLAGECSERTSGAAHHRVKRRVRRPFAEGRDELPAGSAAIRQSIAPIKAPRRDHRKNERAALAEESSINGAIVVADGFRYVGEIEFDRSATNGLEVDEQRSVLGVEDVAGVRLAVQQLLRRASAGNRSGRLAKGMTEKVSVGRTEGGGVVSARYEFLSLRNSIGEVGRGGIELPQAGMKPPQGRCVLPWSNHGR
jgi:hypothetical protein